MNSTPINFEHAMEKSADRSRRQQAWKLGGCIAVWFIATIPFVQGADWKIPLGGNTFRTAPEPGGESIRRDGALRWSDPQEIFSIFFHVNRACHLKLSILGAIERESATVASNYQDRELTKIALHSPDARWMEAGEIQVEAPGYVRIDLRGIETTALDFGRFQDLTVSSSTEGLDLQFVRSNEGNMFYWGRRGPSVHLTYVTPADRELKYAYTELTVPEGQDPIGSYFMANGFREGYFGMQVNTKSERRILFSVWSPFQTDDPKQIPEDQRVVEVARGPGVRIGQFGNEGSGGQSYLVYSWQAGRTYRFLTEVAPDGNGNTIYTSWFSDVREPDWKLIASFRRPRTNTHLRGFHSFLESFNPSWGHVERRCLYGNVWVGDVEGRWEPCSQARFSVDATGGGRHRIDFEGGTQDGVFFLRNCGFFSSSVRAGETFRLELSQSDPPSIEFDKLPR